MVRQLTRPSALTIAFWNANGLKCKRNELEEFIALHQLDVVLISEIHLRPGDEPRIQNYDFYRFDRTDRAGGGTGIYVRRSLDHYEAGTPELRSIEANSVVLRTTFGDLRLTSV